MEFNIINGIASYSWKAQGRSWVCTRSATVHGPYRLRAPNFFTYIILEPIIDIPLNDIFILIIFLTIILSYHRINIFLYIKKVLFKGPLLFFLYIV